jgi:predicted nucleotidyltransferase
MLLGGGNGSPSSAQRGKDDSRIIWWASWKPSNAGAQLGGDISVVPNDDGEGMLTYQQLLRTIHDSGADYVWMGMNAAGAYGSTVGSRDFDFFIRPDPLHLDRARAAFRQLGMTDAWPDIASGNLIAASTTDSFADPGGGPTVDLMTEISGPTFEEVWAQHRIIEFSGVRVRIATLEHIVASKRAANRPQDRYALKRLAEDVGFELKEVAAKYRIRKKRHRPR